MVGKRKREEADEAAKAAKVARDRAANNSYVNSVTKQEMKDLIRILFYEKKTPSYTDYVRKNWPKKLDKDGNPETYVHNPKKKGKQPETRQKLIPLPYIVRHNGHLWLNRKCFPQTRGGQRISHHACCLRWRAEGQGYSACAPIPNVQPVHPH